MTLHARTNYGSEFSIDDIKLASGPPEGVSFDGNIVKICESLCTDSDEDDFDPILVTYSVASIYGFEFPRTAIFNMSATSNGPVISSSLNHHPVIKNGAAHFDLSSELGTHKRLF